VCPWLTCGPIPTGQAVEQGQSSPSGEGALATLMASNNGFLTMVKRMFWVFKRFQRNVASVSRGCCKNRSRCCNVVKLDLDVADVFLNVADLFLNVAEFYSMLHVT
jgi:hypothetical protein